ncbi:nuclear transport factor 2 family protein [Agrococcus sp. SGAir0287]|uniref:nuclear transport factor 2 family protein n=1 Tax=Agrococcus sp. SGAir0287 TaxID=2070347 RepID=UPI0010CD4BF4|nr:nuclear transport factor 2 family protein [Agrococcus sp. SGAir0287]QCR19560.1 DUF4440 domain-containing protein [Agrococcus sp. SGAir0287]
MTSPQLSHDRLLELEHSGWESLRLGVGHEFYGGRMAPDALMVLAHGVALDRDAVVESLDGAAPWDRYDIENVRHVPLGEDAAALVYRATATRGDAPAFHALMTSVYRLVDDVPLLVLYQQTPIPDDD